MPDSHSSESLRLVLNIPPETLEQLRARRSQRKPAPYGPADRPIISTTNLIKNIEELDAQQAATEFCNDMNRLQVEVENEYDAFLLDPGMGPMTYITADGRIIRDYRTWDGEGIRVETKLDNIVKALVVGADKTGIDSLLDLIPRLKDGAQCATCNGARWYQLQNGRTICPTCAGRGECPDT